jgi:hypothetical protein
VQDGSFAQEDIEGIFNKNCAIVYPNVRPSLPLFPAYPFASEPDESLLLSLLVQFKFSFTIWACAFTRLPPCCFLPRKS